MLPIHGKYFQNGGCVYGLNDCGHLQCSDVNCGGFGTHASRSSRDPSL